MLDSKVGHRDVGAGCHFLTEYREAHERSHGLAAPDIYDADHKQGFVILEDLGDTLFAEVLTGGGDEKQLYEHAVEVLAKIHAKRGDAEQCFRCLRVAKDEGYRDLGNVYKDEEFSSLWKDPRLAEIVPPPAPK